MDFEDVDLDLIKFGNLKDYEKHFFTRTIYKDKKKQPIKILSPPLIAESFISDHESGQKYIDLRIDVDDISEDFYDFLLDIDDICIDTIIDNSKEWFGKPVSAKKVKNVYQSIFLENSEDVIRVWFPHDKEIPIYTKDKHKVKDIIRDSKLKVLMTFKGMWINNKASGCLWEIDAALYCYNLKDYLKDCEPKHPSPNWYDNPSSPSLSEEEVVEETVFSLPKSKLISRRKYSTDIVKKHINKELEKEEKKNAKIEKKKLKKLKKEKKKNSKKKSKTTTDELSSSATEIPLDPSPEVFDYIPNNKTPIEEPMKKTMEEPIEEPMKKSIEDPIEEPKGEPIPVNENVHPGFSMPFFNSLFTNFEGVDEFNMEEIDGMDVLNVVKEINKIEILPDDYEDNVKDNSYTIVENDEDNLSPQNDIESKEIECSIEEEAVNDEEERDHVSKEESLLEEKDKFRIEDSVENSNEENNENDSVKTEDSIKNDSENDSAEDSNENSIENDSDKENDSAEDSNENAIENDSDKENDSEEDSNENSIENDSDKENDSEEDSNENSIENDSEKENSIENDSEESENNHKEGSVDEDEKSVDESIDEEDSSENENKTLENEKFLESDKVEE